MSTGLETWNQSMLEIGAAYPFTGTETLLTIIGFGTWIAWHIIQFKSENKNYKEEDEFFSDKKKLENAMLITRRETLASRLNGHEL